MSRVTLVAVAALALSVIGCVSGGEAPPTPIAGSGAVVEVQSYPEGPYGTDVGKIITPYAFPGWVNAAVSRAEADQVEISLEGFYNPTGEGLYPEGSPFGAGNPMPTALVINVSAVWCGPCQFEAANVIPEEYKKVKQIGGEFLLVLAESGTVGEVATLQNLGNWTQAFKVNYPAVIDPSRKLGQLFDQNAFPANFLVDLRTMTIVELATGLPNESFWAKLESLALGAGDG